jgi:hypothetical protein
MNPGFGTHPHYWNPELWGGELENKNPMEKFVLSMHHPYMVVCLWVLAGSLWPARVLLGFTHWAWLDPFNKK